MCGILGVFQFDANDTIDLERFQRGLRLLAHRGPDDAGIFLQGSVALGSRRLAILDQTSAGRQPFVSNDDAVAVVVNGEFYNARELRATLEQQGVIFRSHSDSEVLLHLYPRLPQTSIQRLRGMFALAIWDATRQTLTLARDRAGQKPLYYHVDKRGIRFSSEIKALLVEPDIPHTLDLIALDYYLSLQYIPHPLTAFQDIAQLPPGHVLEVDRSGVVRVQPYWNLPAVDLECQRSVEACADELEALICRAVRSHYQSDVPVGLFLSGGLDSGTIAVAANDISEQPHCMSVYYKEQGWDESGIARIVAKQLNFPFERSPVDEAIVSDLATIIWHMGTPCGDPSFLPFFALARHSRQRMKVALTGDGGDELFGGYPRYRDLTCEMQSQSEPASDWVPLLLKHSRFFDHTIKDMCYTERFKSIAGTHDRGIKMFMQAFVERHRPVSAVNALMLWDLKHYLPDDLLFKVDSMTMASGLESRAPFLDEAVMEWAASIPPAVHVSEVETKRIVKALLRRRLPPRFVDRPKWGLRGPIAPWLRGQIWAPFVEQLRGGGLVKHDLFQPGALKQLLRGYEDGTGIDGILMWILIVLDRWLDICFSRNPEELAPAYVINAPNAIIVNAQPGPDRA